MPQLIVQRSYIILDKLAGQEKLSSTLPHSVKQYKPEIEALQKENARLKEIIAQLKEIDCNQLSPRQAFDVLWQLKEKISF